METPDAPALRRVSPSRLSPYIRRPVACALTLVLSGGLYSAFAQFAGGELAAVSRVRDQDWEIGASLAFKLAGPLVAWYAGYDYLDLASLAALGNVPYYFLLSAFYGVHYSTTVVALTIDVVAAALPLALLGFRNHPHDTTKPRTENQVVAQDWSINGLISLLGAAVFSIAVYSGFYTWLPSYLIVHFDGLRSLEYAHESSLPLIVLLFFPIGAAVTQFLFVPAVGTAGNPGLTDLAVHPDKAPFDPENASFAQTLAYNVGFGHASKRAEVLAKRTAVLVACTSVSTFVRVLFALEGTEVTGAAGWAALWGSACALTGLAFALVANE
nr:hypothetical protein CFP56_79540 [Quercus suber]